MCSGHVKCMCPPLRTTPNTASHFTVHGTPLNIYCKWMPLNFDRSPCQPLKRYEPWPPVQLGQCARHTRSAFSWEQSSSEMKHSRCEFYYVLCVYFLFFARECFFGGERDKKCCAWTCQFHSNYLFFSPHTSKGKRKWQRSVGVWEPCCLLWLFQRPNKTMTADASRPLEARSHFCSAESIIDSSIILAPEKCMIKVRQKKLNWRKNSQRTVRPRSATSAQWIPPTTTTTTTTTTIFSSDFKSVAV